MSLGFSEKKKIKQKITKMTTTIAVVAFTVLGIWSLGGSSAYGQPSPPSCPPGFVLDRGQCVGCVEGQTLVGDQCVGERLAKQCPEGTSPEGGNLYSPRCVGRPGTPAGTGN
jgi:hypothetical protein